MPQYANSIDFDTSSSGSSSSASKPRLQVWFNGTTCFLSEGSTIGRGAQADLQIDHRQVSSIHAEVRRNGTSWELHDRNSTNGIYSNSGKQTVFSFVTGRSSVWLGPPHSAPCLEFEVEEDRTPQHFTQRSEPESPAPQSFEGFLAQSPPPVSAPPTSPTAPVPLSEDTPSAIAYEQMVANLGEHTAHLDLDFTQVVIGRDPVCTITLQDPQVSRRHAELSLSTSGGSIQDLGSANGTFVNGQRISTAALQNGDLIEIGHAQFLVNNGRLDQHIAYGLPLTAQQLSVTVSKGLKILDDISFTLPAGSMTAIVGPSGSGKTTLLNALTGRRPADEGKVYLGGRDLYGARESLGRSIGFVPQDDPVHETLTVKKALTAAAQLRLPADISKAEVNDDVKKVASELGLGQRLNTRIKALSGGQKKRVSVGYELVGEPQALILDEPTSGLDPGLERELMLNLRDLANKGTTTIVVTHSVQSVELCDQVVVLAPGGRLVYIGSPKQTAAHFGCANIAEVFTLLSNPPHAGWADQFVQRLHAGSPPNIAPSKGAPAPVPKRSFSRDFRVLTRRYIASLFGEKRRLLMLFAQPPILGLILAFTLGTKAFSSISLGSVGDTYYYVFSTVLIMTWFGAISSIREVVDERAAFRRERAVGVSSTAFILSKWVVLCFVVFIQAILLHLAASLRQEERIGSGVLFGWGELEFIVSLAGVAIACVGLGLVLSALAKDAPRAITILPLVLVAIVLFSGLLLPTDGRSGIEQVSFINPVQWGGSSAAVTSNLLEANNCNGSQPGDTVDVALAKYFSPKIACSQRWEPTAGNQLLNFAMLLLLSIFSLLAAGATTRWVLGRPENR